MKGQLTTRGRSALVGVLFALCGCSSLDGHSGLGEPFVVHNAQFFSGELPGEPPLEPGSGASPVPPTTTSGTPSKADLRQGLAGVSFTGQASDDAVVVATRLEGEGTGYWLLPTLFRDVQARFKLT
jgi:hypothetical protein